MNTREQLEEQILSFLRNNGGRSFRAKEIAKKLNIRDNNDFRDFRKIIESLKIEGRIGVERGGQISYRVRASQIEGILRVHRDGFGFVSTEGEEQDIFVRGRNMLTAIDGDRVLVAKTAAKPGDSRTSGEILAVLERTRTQAVGTLQMAGAFGVVIPDDMRLMHDIYVSENDLNGASDGDKVVVSIDSFADRRGAIQGTVLNVLGPANDPGVQTLAVALDAGVRSEFSDDLLKEVKQKQTEGLRSAAASRKDLRAKDIFTIDPDDAKDFDDAIHLDVLPDGTYEIGVHIADVSHFVQKDTALDAEAYARGTSVYLVDRVIPMLPEELSNDLCSLKPREDRLAFSCIMKVSEDGSVLSEEICETIIHSRFRLAYEEAQTILDAAEESIHPLSKTLSIANRMAKRMSAARHKRGSISFDTAEVRVVLNEEGQTVNIVRRERVDAHRLVEEFMLLANRTVARVMIENEDRPFISRIHEPPNREKIIQLASFIRPFGYTLQHKEGLVSAEELNNLLDSIRGNPEESIIEMAALRSMSKARYGLETTGHYGLAEPFYTHFTSPIRRYPDLIVHRLIKDRQLGLPSPDATILTENCDHVSEREKVAVDAERASVRLKTVEYAANHLGESFAGVATGVTKYGVFVLISDLLVEGMVHVRDLDDDYYEYDERSYALVGTRTGKTYRLGSPVKVIIAAANVETKEIDLVFDGPKKPAKGRQKRSEKKKPRAHKKGGTSFKTKRRKH